MTINEWLAEYYPTPAGRFGDEDSGDPDIIAAAAGHARQKWEGAKPEILQQLPGSKNAQCITDVSKLTNLFGSYGCALCWLFEDNCGRCPLPRVENEFYGKVGRHNGCSSGIIYAYGKAKLGKPEDLIQILKKIEEGDTGV